MDAATLADERHCTLGVLVQHQMTRIERHELASGDLGLVAKPVEAKRAVQPAHDGHATGELPEDARRAAATVYRGGSLVVTSLDLGGAGKRDAAVRLVACPVAQICAKSGAREGVERRARPVRGGHLLPTRPVDPAAPRLVGHRIRNVAEGLLVEGDGFGENRMQHESRGQGVQPDGDAAAEGSTDDVSLLDSELSERAAK